MRITKIEITNYKSIKEPVEINFYNGLPTVLIGKNGSGKTNILEALSAVAEANGNYFGMRKELPLKYKVHIRLEKEDVERLFPGKSIDEKCEFAACSGEDCKINRIESEYLVPLLRMEIDEISELAGELQDALDTYTQVIVFAVISFLGMAFQVHSFISIILIPPQEARPHLVPNFHLHYRYLHPQIRIREFRCHGHQFCR